MFVSILFDIGVWLNVKPLKMFDEEEEADENKSEMQLKNGVEAKGVSLACGKDALATDAILSHRREHRGSIDL